MLLCWLFVYLFWMFVYNGEINIIEGNCCWVQVCSKVWKMLCFDIVEFDLVIFMYGLDLQSLDNMLELMVVGGMELIQVLCILVLLVIQLLEFKDFDLVVFYEFYGFNSELWDGLVGIVVCDSCYVVCMLDCNGLCLVCWMLIVDCYFFVVFEVGVWEVLIECVVCKGKFGFGEMVVIDFKCGDLFDLDVVDCINRGCVLYKQWLQQGVIYLQIELIDLLLVEELFDEVILCSYYKFYQFSSEEVEQVLWLLVEIEQEVIGLMGDDILMVVLSQCSCLLYDYFCQVFVQVINLLIDLLCEDCVMLLFIQFGKEINIFYVGLEMVNYVIFNLLVFSQCKLCQLLKMDQYVQVNCLFDLFYSEDEGLCVGIECICVEVEQVVCEGMVMLLLFDCYLVVGWLMVYVLFVISVIYYYFLWLGLCCDVNFIVEIGIVCDLYYMVCLFGFGVIVVYLYLVYQILFDLG